MRIFEKPNTSNGWKCSICKRNTESPVVLVGISGTEEDGNIEAEQIHVSCIELTIFERGIERLMIQYLPEKEKP